MVLTKNNSRAIQRQIDLTTAVCQERLLATHVRHVLGFVELVADRIPFDDAMDIYVRILRLNAEQARNVGSRALAELAQRSGTDPRARDLELVTTDDDIDEAEGEETTAAGGETGRTGALFSRFRQRIKGRVQEDLRNRINLAAARTEDDMVQAHVENSLIFARALADEMPASEAVELYLETMMIPEGVADVIYNRALRTIAERVLPPLPHTRDSEARAADAAAAEAAVVERQG